MKVTVKFLATAREIAGVREETLQLEGGTTVIEILKVLAARHENKLKEYLSS